MKTGREFLSEGGDDLTLEPPSWLEKEYYGCRDHPFRHTCQECVTNMDKYDRKQRRVLRRYIRVATKRLHENLV